MGTFAPIVVRWLYAGMYQLLPRFDRYRLHARKEEKQKNLVTMSTVVKGVLLQQDVQATIARILSLVKIHLCLSSCRTRQVLFGYYKLLLKNDTAYHDIHPQLQGSKYNYSQPIFSIWDRILVDLQISCSRRRWLGCETFKRLGVQINIQISIPQGQCCAYCHVLRCKGFCDTIFLLVLLYPLRPAVAFCLQRLENAHERLNSFLVM